MDQPPPNNLTSRLISLAGVKWSCLRINKQGCPPLAWQVFKHHSKANDPEMSVFVSFGGLLMHLRGDESNLSKLDLDSRIYILIRKN